jgi:hypothetical protein
MDKSEYTAASAKSWPGGSTLQHDTLTGKPILYGRRKVLILARAALPEAEVPCTDRSARLTSTFSSHHGCHSTASSATGTFASHGSFTASYTADIFTSDGSFGPSPESLSHVSTATTAVTASENT